MGVTLGPAVAGVWYPGRPDELRTRIDRLLASQTTRVPAERPARVRALIAPHAGVVYSGEVAAAVFQKLSGMKLGRVVLLGPSHHASFRGAVVPDADNYRTPLGDVPIDTSAVDTVLGCPRVRRDNGPFVREHCLEIELPFLQQTLEPGWRVVPLLLGHDARGGVAQEIADVVRAVVDSDTLVVASSDFTHYGYRFGYAPFREKVPERIRELDHGVIPFMEALDVEGMENYLDDTGATVCGRHAIDVLLRLLPNGVRGKLVRYETSGALTGDWDHSVSYASVVFTETGGD